MSAPSPTPRTLALADLASELVSAFECPVCLNAATAPIFLCKNGHHVCSTCRTVIHKCPLCRETIGKVRALAMERVAKKLPRPCKYSEYGCPTQPLPIEKPDHENTCAFRAYPCVFKAEYSCNWSGLPANMIDHIRIAHPGERVPCGEKAKHILQATGLYEERRAVQASFGQVFLFVLTAEKIGSQPFILLNRLLVQFLGYPEEAKKFSLQVKMKGNSHTITWTCKPTSYLERVNDVIERGGCLYFDTSGFNRDNSLTLDVTAQQHSVECGTTVGQ